jgi:hypothetical protein
MRGSIGRGTAIGSVIGVVPAPARRSGRRRPASSGK